MQQQRSSFSGRMGFVLAAAGSAVGLGNIWRFPYLAAKYGGGIFLLVYIILAITFGATLMLAEVTLGRKTRLSAIGAYGALDRRFGFIGALTSLVPIIIFPYYSVIGGWVTKYFVALLSGNLSSAASDGYFGDFISRTAEPVGWLFLFMGLSALVVFCGVEKGIEKASRLLMPLLVVLTVAIAVYVLLQPGSGEGLRYYLTPDFSRFSPITLLAAIGQLFYSMSLAMGIMITYGSYMKREVDLEKSVTQIELFDTSIAILAGLIIVPAVFVFSGGDEAALSQGPGLMFVTLPKVFQSMPLGGAIGTAFFALVLCAALTSAISLMETVVSIVRDRFGWRRRTACLIVLLFSLAIALPSSLGYGPWSGVELIGMQFLDFFDFLSNSVIMPVVALLTCLFVGFAVGTGAIAEEIRLSSPFRKEKLFHLMIKFVAPLLLLSVLVTSILEAFGLLRI